MKKWLKQLIESTGYRLVKADLLEYLSRSRWDMGNTLRRIAGYGIEPSTMIDMGAARGEWSAMAMEVFPKASYLLVEPLEEHRATLKQFTSKHSHAQAEIVAVGADEGMISFNVTGDLDGSGVFGPQNENKVREVEQATLDQLVRRHDLKGQYFLKFDTHGYETAILQGAEQVLKQTSCVLMECYTFKISPTCQYFWEMCADMDKRGFRIADMADPWPRAKDGALWQMDFVWLRKEHPLFSSASYH